MSDTVSRWNCSRARDRWPNSIASTLLRWKAYLREHVEASLVPLSVEQFKGGQSDPTFKAHHPARPT